MNHFKMNFSQKHNDSCQKRKETDVEREERIKKIQDKFNAPYLEGKKHQLELQEAKRVYNLKRIEDEKREKMESFKIRIEEAKMWKAEKEERQKQEELDNLVKNQKEKRIKRIQDICDAPYRKKQMDSRKREEESEFKRRFEKEQKEMEKTKRYQEKEERYQEFKKRHIQRYKV